MQSTRALTGASISPKIADPSKGGDPNDHPTGLCGRAVPRRRADAGILRGDARAPARRAARFEFWIGDTCCGIWEPDKMGGKFAPQKNGHLALHVEDIEAARKELAAKGVQFYGETLDTGVCAMAFFSDPDGNDLMLHHRYAPRK